MAQATRSAVLDAQAGITKLQELFLSTTIGIINHFLLNDIG
jgi:hypothetical protein